jgi:hypothetical protein
MHADMRMRGAKIWRSMQICMIERCVKRLLSERTVMLYAMEDACACFFLGLKLSSPSEISSEPLSLIYDYTLNGGAS